MPVTPSIQEFLRLGNVPYTVLPHLPAYTAQEEAAIMHIPGRDWAKAVVCFADAIPIQAVVPGDRVVALERLRRLVGADDIRLAREDELDWLYPDCERGAMPPLGPLFHQRVYVDVRLAAEDEIVFNAGTHHEAVCMRFDDFATLTRPIVGNFAELPGSTIAVPLSEL